DRGISSGDGGGDDPGPRTEPVARSRLLVAHRDQGAAVHDSGGVARVVHMVDLLDPVVLLERYGVEAAHLADGLEGGLQRGEAVGRGAGPDVLVMVEDRQTVAVGDGDEGALKP